MKKWIVPVGIIVLLVVMMISGYNNLVRTSESVNGSWSQVQNQLQRRADLIPNLVETVKGYASQEKEVFTAVAEARAKLAGAATVGDAAQADQALTGALGRLLAISESYPQLKSDANFRTLQDELAGTENRIATARMDYNNSVESYNAKIKTAPTVLYAGIFGFEQRDYFKPNTNVNNVPAVNF
ncbi:LemA family protein [Desulfosporosinus sp. BICA1-9]|uniref:LemA family protein n=1 Tax=Desulfosporosinus sp. BICA1-9 TaxID=1531958 RepID=UPI00054C3EE5|nr:LemA family protein [Desulfosporosinus sp. BICA1-9]KJS48475.1 MAG: LemA family protein [Peptococcaceae bacterium BRH_c23]KJS89450.1 MAG: LemA family protein [Desulfosporosinus sp. BICA1-9]HBW37337.1 LemA family protein [Desulfosporosinus sp.]